MAGGLALCGRTPKGPVLRGPEVMPCWDAAVPPAAPAPTAPSGRLPVSTRSVRTFVPVDDVQHPTASDDTVAQAARDAALAGRAQPDWGWVLFAELEA